MLPAEDLVAVADFGLRGRQLAIGSRLLGEILQWYDGRELHLLRGRLLSETVRRRSFEFQLAADGTSVKFTELTAEDFEKRFRSKFPDAPARAPARELSVWLLRNHGLWPLSPAPPASESRAQN